MNRATGKILVVMPPKPPWMPVEEFEFDGLVVATTADGPSADAWSEMLSTTMLVDDNPPEAPGLWIWEGDYYWNDSHATTRGEWRRPTAMELWRLANGHEVFIT